MKVWAATGGGVGGGQATRRGWREKKKRGAEVLRLSATVGEGGDGEGAVTVGGRGVLVGENGGWRIRQVGVRRQ